MSIPTGNGNDRMLMLGLFGVVMLVMSAVNVLAMLFFLLWTYQAAQNVRAFGQYALEHSPAWAVGSWFVPIIGLWVPYQALTEIWRASDPETVGTNDTAWVTRPVHSLFPIWWVTYLLYSFVAILGSLSPFLLGHPRAAIDEPGGGVIGLGANCFLVIAAVAIVSPMRQVDQRQQRCAAKLSL